MPGVRSTAAWQRLRAQVLAEELTCHLCGGPYPDTVDHLIPIVVAPHLALERSNVRAAHGRKTRQCPGNYGRKAKPLAPRRPDPPPPAGWERTDATW